MAYYRRAADVAAGMFAHAEAIRLHQQALSVVRGLPPGRDRDRQELDVLEALAAPLNARFGYSVPGAAAGAGALGRAGRVAGPPGCAAHRPGRALDARSSCRGARPRATGRRPAPWPWSTRPREASGPAHFAVGGSAVSLGRPAEALRHLELAAELASGGPSLSIGTRADVHGQAFAAHAHWLLGHDDDALSSCQGAIGLARAIDHPYNLAVALAYAAITHQLRGDLAGDAGRRRRADGAVRAVRLRLLPRVGADPGRLVAPGRVGHRPGPAAASTTCEAAGSFARMPYWLSLLADLYARDGQAGAARATLDAALAAGQAHDDLWWLPEVMRMRAAYDEERARHRAAARRGRAGGGPGQRRAAPAVRA